MQIKLRSEKRLIVLVPALQHASASYVNIFDLVKPFTSEVVAAWTFNFELESEIYLTVFRTAGSFIFTLSSGQCPLRREAIIQVYIIR